MKVSPKVLKLICLSPQYASYLTHHLKMEGFEVYSHGHYLEIVSGRNCSIIDIPKPQAIFNFTKQGVAELVYRLAKEAGLNAEIRQIGVFWAVRIRQ